MAASRLERFYEGQLLLLMPFASSPTPENVFGIFSHRSRACVVKHPTSGVWVFKMKKDGGRDTYAPAPPWEQHGPVPCVVIDTPQAADTIPPLNYVVMVEEGNFLFVDQKELIDHTLPEYEWILEKLETGLKQEDNENKPV